VRKDKSSAVAEMGDRGHNRHGPKRGGAVPLSRAFLVFKTFTKFKMPSSTRSRDGTAPKLKAGNDTLIISSLGVYVTYLQWSTNVLI